MPVPAAVLVIDAVAGIVAPQEACLDQLGDRAVGASWNGWPKRMRFSLSPICEPASFNAPMICSSVDLLRFISFVLVRAGL